MSKEERADGAKERRWTRRDALLSLSALGVGAAALSTARGVLAAEGAMIDADTITRAEWLTGLSLTPGERELMLNGVREIEGYLATLRTHALDNSVPPAFRFAPLTGEKDVDGVRSSSSAHTAPDPAQVLRPADTELAFLPVTALSDLVRTRKVSSEELTRLYLSRLDAHDPALRCVITRTSEMALDAARRADREIGAGRYRGPLHGIPWGAKDIIAVAGHPTTWGAAPYRDQVLDVTATVVDRLTDAGAVLVAKLSVGALAWGDVWFDATTKNPWNLEEGSSGSSAGSASATAAGLVGFALGTETWGSIISPCTRCGATGLRPTFGRVSRHGVMALSWTMDKLGPITRAVDDCALVLDAIRGRDGLDAMAVDRPFGWPYAGDVRSLRIGYVPALFEEDRAAAVTDDSGTPEEVSAMREALGEWAELDRATLATLREMGFDLVPVELPASETVDALQIILLAEAASAFDELTRSGRDDLLVRQEEHAWPNVFRYSQLIPAVEYIRATRLRHVIMEDMESKLRDVDVFVAPSFGGNHLLLTNLTGHPSVVLPNGFRSAQGTPTSITFTGKCYEESALLAVASAYQNATSHHLAHPDL